MITALNINQTFFQLLRNQKKLIEGSDFDNQFSLVVNFLNNTIVNEINQIVVEPLTGIEDFDNYFLANVGDGTLTFKPLNDLIIKNTISLNQLQPTLNIGGLLIATDDGSIDFLVNPNLDFLVLQYQEDVGLIYDQIHRESISDHSITNDHFQKFSLNINHFNENTVNLINEDKLLNLNFADECIDQQNLNAISFGKAELALDYNLDYLLDEPNLYLYNREYYELYGIKFFDGRQALANHFTPEHVRYNPGGSIQISPINFKEVQCISEIIPNSITKYFFTQYNQLAINPNREFYEVNTYKKITQIPPYITNRVLHPNFKIFSEHLVITPVNNYNFRAIIKDDFDDEVKKAFENKGCK